MGGRIARSACWREARLVGSVQSMSCAVNGGTGTISARSASIAFARFCATRRVVPVAEMYTTNCLLMALPSCLFQ